MRNIATAVIAAALTSACASTAGPGPIVGPRGIVARPVVTNDAVGISGDLFQRFEDAAGALAAGTATADPFLESGFALIYADCDEFFRAMGKNQRSSRVVRDTIAPITALLTGIIGLRDFGAAKEERLLTAMSLWSSLSTSGFDIYDRHFLFGAENSDSVRELILNALTVHSTSAYQTEPTTFEDAAIQLVDNQTICTPPHILRLVREAIRNGDVEPTFTGTASTQQDFETRRALGQLLHPPSPTSDAETRALWLLLVEETPESQAELKELYGDLKNLGDRNPVKETTDGTTVTYAYKPDWPFEDAVFRHLVSLPAQTLARYQAESSEAPAVAGGEGGGNVAPVRAAGRRGTQRVGVSVPR